MELINICTVFDMFEVKIPIIFSARWVNRYVDRDISFKIMLWVFSVSDSNVVEDRSLAPKAMCMVPLNGAAT
jgi:hypothetical protein